MNKILNRNLFCVHAKDGMYVCNDFKINTHNESVTLLYLCNGIRVKDMPSIDDASYLFRYLNATNHMVSIDIQDYRHIELMESDTFMRYAVSIKKNRGPVVAIALLELAGIAVEFWSNKTKIIIEPKPIIIPRLDTDGKINNALIHNYRTKYLEYCAQRYLFDFIVKEMWNEAAFNLLIKYAQKFCNLEQTDDGFNINGHHYYFRILGHYPSMFNTLCLALCNCGLYQDIFFIGVDEI